jgi:[acyl-carrier-protein] S-malonyltransferase
MNTLIVFPAYVNNYSGKEQQFISECDCNFRELLIIASDTLKLDLTGFDFQKNNFLNDELKSQYITYIFSCSLAEILKKHFLDVDLVSGYSMGIYAALYYCGTISFTDGLQIIKSAWENISKVTMDRNYGMGIVVGLDQNDIMKFIREVQGVDICNRNNPHTYIISGIKEDVERILDLSKSEGALNAKLLPASKPYHSKYIMPAENGFANDLKNIQFKNSSDKYISTINRKAKSSGEELKIEVIRNIYTKINWFETIQAALAMGVNSIYECGAGDGLTQNSRFIPGNFKSYTFDKLKKFLNSNNE